jgi:hypothetical protein
MGPKLGSGVRRQLAMDDGGFLSSGAVSPESASLAIGLVGDESLSHSGLRAKQNYPFRRQGMPH